MHFLFPKKSVYLNTVDKEISRKSDLIRDPRIRLRTV